MDTDTNFLPAVLLQQVKQRRRTSEPETAFDYAVAAAVEPDREQRAWALVALAARLRKENNQSLALEVLDAAVALAPSWRAESAAFTTAAAIHCDRGDLRKAKAICDQTMARGVDEYVLKVAVRVYWELAQETKLQELYDRWKELSSALDLISASADVPASGNAP